MSGIFWFKEEKTMEIHGTIHFKLILPHFPGFSRSRCQRLFAAVRRNVTAALIPAMAFSAGARTEPACGPE